MLIVAQIALSLVLVAGAGLLVRSMALLLAIAPGYDPENVVLLSVRAPGRGQEQIAFWQDVLGRVQSVPGARAAAAVDYGPPARVYVTERYEVLGEPSGQDGSELNANTRSVTRD